MLELMKVRTLVPPEIYLLVEVFIYG